MASLQKQRALQYADIIEEEYSYWCGRGDSGITTYIVPHIDDIADETEQSIRLKMRDQSIREALERGDHDLYGFPPDVFAEDARRDRLVHFHPDTPNRIMVEHAVQAFLHAYYYSYTARDNRIINSPIGEGIW